LISTAPMQIRGNAESPEIKSHIVMVKIPEHSIWAGLYYNRHTFILYEIRLRPSKPKIPVRSPQVRSLQFRAELV
jgi:hypothetical protein